ncbi:flavodoxin [Spirochaetia bacterium]|nr:flavodoxin [Spirochaetia bacterium]
MMKRILVLVAAIFCVGATMEISAQTGSNKILVAYFSHSGNTRTVAEQIHRTVGGDLLEIKTVTPYTGSYNEVLDTAQNEQRANARPALATRINNLASYDTIFIGYPIWWGTMPMAFFTLFEQYNFAGKTILPFCTHEGSALGRSVTDIKRLAPQSTVRDGLAIRGGSAGRAGNDITAWLRKNGIAER